MDATSVESWIADYLGAFTACSHGQAPVDSLFEYYAIPLLLTTDDGVRVLTTRDEALAVFQPMIDAMRSNGYDHSDSLDAQVTVVNRVTALYEAAFSRKRGDGSEISQLRATYVVGDGDLGRRISAILLHGA